MYTVSEKAPTNGERELFDELSDMFHGRGMDEVMTVLINLLVAGMTYNAPRIDEYDRAVDQTAALMKRMRRQLDKKIN